MTEVPLLPGERIDDLQLQNLHIIQADDAFRFCMDSVLLADFAGIKPGFRVCDLGTGTGILPLLLYGRAEITCDAVEIMQEAAERASRTMVLNGLADKITVHARDLRQIREFLQHAQYDCVVCNPPYSPANASLASPKQKICNARQDNTCTLSDIADAAKWLLKYHGKLCLMLPASRLTEAMIILHEKGIEPKRLRFVHSSVGKPARLALIEGMRDAHGSVVTEPPLITHNADGTESDEVKRIYHITI